MSPPAELPAATLDSNVLVSGFVRPESVPGMILRRWREGMFRLVLSEHILEEVGETLREPYFQQFLDERQVVDDLALLRQEAVVVELSVEVRGVATHPEDDVILATAVSAAVGVLVTGDKQLLRLGSFREVAIISPREFLDRLA